MKTINIKGKEYIPVNERIKEFRNTHKDYSLATDIVNLTDSEVIMKAIICDETGRIVATGFAHEIKDSSLINKTSFIENCETSAWGRALGNLGIGVDTSIASAEEMTNALQRQEIIEETENSNEVCEICGEKISGKVASYSKSKFGKALCFKCQKNGTSVAKVDTL